MPPRPHLVVIGGSAGAVTALQLLLARLPSDLPAAVCVVMHLSPSKPSMLADILRRVVVLPVEPAWSGAPLDPGRVYVAVPGHHLRVDDGAVQIETTAKENGHRPSIDVLFRSAARHWGDRVVGVVLSGMLDDGAAGAREIKARGGLVAVQDPAEAEYPDMPTHAMEAVNPDVVAGLEGLANWLIAQVGERSDDQGRNGHGAGADGQRDAASDEARLRSSDDLAVTCPECHGPVMISRDGDLLQFGCIVGHWWSETSFVHEHGRAVEAALWASVRVLEERANLYDRLAQQSSTTGRTSALGSFELRADRAREQAGVLRQLITSTATDVAEDEVEPVAVAVAADEADGAA